MTRLSMMLLAVAVLSGTAHAAPMQCTPKDNTARILESPNPNDTARDFKKGWVGLSWSFIVKRTVNDPETGKYFQGDLISPRGGTVNRNVYILAKEWDCGN